MIRQEQLVQHITVNWSNCEISCKDLNVLWSSEMQQDYKMKVINWCQAAASIRMHVVMQHWTLTADYQYSTVWASPKAHLTTDQLYNAQI